MITQSSANILRSQMAAHLVAHTLSRDDIALDIIELIALRMATREDYQVAVVGYFVRANLLYLDKGIITFCDVVDRLTAAALSAPLGHQAFTEALSAGSGRA